MSEMSGKVVLVTGASSGIGRAVARRFASAGATVAVVGRNQESLQAVAAEVSGSAHLADLSQATAAHEVVAAAAGLHGRLDVLVNAAGIIASGTIETTSDDAWDRMMGINLDATFRAMRAAVPHLRPHRGSIVNVSSVTGLRSFPGVLAYCVSKAAVDQLTRCAALELAADGIRVNAVNPGVVVTELHRRSGMKEDAYAAFLEHSKTTHPLGRVGSPPEVAEAVYFLASEASGWITGATLSVDGGRHLTCAR